MNKEQNAGQEQELEAEDLFEADLGEEAGSEEAGEDQGNGQPEDQGGTGQEEERYDLTDAAGGTGQEEERYDLTDAAGGTRQVTRAEMEQLARRGLQMDGVNRELSSLRQERDALASYRQQHDATLSEITQLAEMAGVDVATYLTALHENVLVSKGMNRDEAKRWVQRQREQAQAREQQASQARAQQQAAQQRRDADIQAFLNKWPGVDPKTIPQTVWEAVRQGETLVSAYGAHEAKTLKAENQRLQQQLAATAKNGSNHAAAVGSVKTSGSKTTIDPFLQGFNAE